jgi:hypothetical protein
MSSPPPPEKRQKPVQPVSAHIIDIEPRPLYPGSRVKVVGVSSDALPELIRTWTKPKEAA